MSDRLPGYTDERDQLIVNMFFGYPSETGIAKLLGIRPVEVTAALEHFATRVAVLADQHWQERVLAQVNELQKICDHLCEAEDPPHASVALRVRIAALLAASEPPAPATVTMPGDAATRRPPTRRTRRLEFAPAQRAGELAHTE
jgi:hypothetical protein